ncbi:unnamed protein product [Chrysodeixis includens]|uniref:Uncharacterized protein n=1 Tax=Chrysodeixis includens TaxID=689277 RepID=A0A9P0BS90_CHRIL|nr:unnamed protein product [Chrysodeixis includens]
MNVADSTGGSSRKGQENGDASSESERPLKKARFAWQVKGKYHLKNDASEISKTSRMESLDPDLAGSSGSASSSKNVGAEQNLEILGDYLLKQDFNTLDSVHPVISDPEKSIHKPGSSVPTEKLQYPRYVSSFDNVTNNELRTNDNSNEFGSHPISMVASPNLTEDHYIARWQAKQMAKGVIDNTINRVLDSWIQVPLPQEEDGSRFLALDVTDFINNLPGDNSIENEGILMAISAHGLQNTSNSNSSSDTEDVSTSSVSTDSLPQIPIPRRSFSPLLSDDESQELSIPCDTDTSSNDLDLPWSYSDNRRLMTETDKTETNDTHFPLFPDASNLSYPYPNENNPNSNAFDGNMVDNHCDFLDAAVTFAIQSKGLTTLGTDYG